MNALYMWSAQLAEDDAPAAAAVVAAAVALSAFDSEALGSAVGAAESSTCSNSRCSVSS